MIMQAPGTFLKQKQFAGIHFIGIGGIGLSGLAIIFQQLGYQVQGSDLAVNENTEKLQRLGIQIFTGHKAEHIKEASCIVISSAVQDTNPELQAALQQGLPVLSRAKALAEIVKLKYAIAISGSHGKTTTTALIANMFTTASLDPSILVGGITNNQNTNAYLGSGEYLIVEADESDGTFIEIPAKVVVVTNISSEHLDFYQTFDNLIAAFGQFINNVPRDGFAIVCIDDTIVKDLVQNSSEQTHIITYGFHAEAQVRAGNIRVHGDHTVFDVAIARWKAHLPNEILQIRLGVSGIQNVQNSLAAISIGLECGFDLETIRRALESFKGVKRRFTNTGTYCGARIIDDYAHHPLEITATTKTAKQIVDRVQGKIFAIFQPHRYSRLNQLFESFITCFELVDHLYIMPIYSAGEAKHGADHLDLIEAIKKERIVQVVEYVDSLDTLTQYLQKCVTANDLIVFMGAGSVTNWAYQLPTL